MSTSSTVVFIHVPKSFSHVNVKFLDSLEVFSQFLKCIVPFAFVLSLGDANVKVYTSQYETVIADALQKQTTDPRITDSEDIGSVEYVPCLVVRLATCSEKREGKLQICQVVIRIVTMGFHASSKAETFLLMRTEFHMNATTSMHEIIDAIFQFLR